MDVYVRLMAHFYLRLPTNTENELNSHCNEGLCSSVDFNYCDKIFGLGPL